MIFMTLICKILWNLACVIFSGEFVLYSISSVKKKKKKNSEILGKQFVNSLTGDSEWKQINIYKLINNEL